MGAIVSTTEVDEMKEDLTNDCKRCGKCGTYFIEAIGESCRCAIDMPEDYPEMALAEQWLAGEMSL